MYCSIPNLLLLPVCTSSALSFPYLQSLLQPPCATDVDTISETSTILSVSDGYQGPGVYYLTSYADGFHASLSTNGTGDGAPLVTWSNSLTLLSLCM